MKNDSLQQFVKLRRGLTEERGSLEVRLRQINEALGEMPLSSLASIQGATGRSTAQGIRRGRRLGDGGLSLREHVIGALKHGPQTKEEVLAAVQKSGYKFATNNPMNSLGVILYGKNPKLNRADGKFSLGTEESNGTMADESKPSGRGGRRKMSAAGRARIAAAQRARWAKQNGAAKLPEPVKVGVPKAKRRMSVAGRKAIADAARKRWTAAKASGKSKL